MRYAVDIDFPHTDITPELGGEIIHLALEQGLKSLGHAQGVTVNFSVEKMRQRQSLDLEEKVEQK